MDRQRAEWRDHATLRPCRTIVPVTRIQHTRKLIRIVSSVKLKKTWGRFRISILGTESDVTRSHIMSVSWKNHRSHTLFLRNQIIRRIFSHVFGEDVTRRLWNNPKRSWSSIEGNNSIRTFCSSGNYCLFIYFLRVHNVMLILLLEINSISNKLNAYGVQIIVRFYYNIIKTTFPYYNIFYLF